MPHPTADGPAGCGGGAVASPREQVVTLPFRRRRNLVEQEPARHDEIGSLDLAVGIGDEWVRDIVAEVRPFTMTSAERIYGLCLAVDHVCRRGIPGAFAECGVWRGGSAMAIALSLQRRGETDRQLTLFDTFEGMTAPTEMDRDIAGRPASTLLMQEDRSTSAVWAQASLEEVQQNLAGTGYSRVNFVVGDVMETIPGSAPSEIALLRLDTDWYESTLHELVHLYPRVQSGGIVIIDDYGHWSGARKAVDQYFSGRPNQPFLCPLDYTGRLAVVP